MALVVMVISLSANSLAQSSGVAPSHPLADSAAVARDRYRAAVAARRAENLPEARRLAGLAQRAWPSQPTYLAAMASWAARALDTTAAAIALGQLLELGATYPVERDPAFDALRAAPPIRDIVAKLSERTGPLVRSRVESTIGPEDFFAEGVARAADGTLYLGSIRQQRVLERRPDGRERDLATPADGLWAISGIALTPDGGALWVSSNAIPQMAGYDSTLDGRSELLQISVRGGVSRRIPVPAAGGAMLGDILVMPDGGVYASDTRGQAIWYLEPGGSVPRIVARHPLLRSPQGMVRAVDGRRLLVADYSHGILRVDPATGVVEPLSFPAGSTVLSVDGLARHGRDLIAIQNSGVVPRVIRLRLDASESRIVAVEVLDRNVAVADEPTLGVVAGDDFYYVANSQWEKRNEDGTPMAGATLAPTIILRLPLR